MRKMSSAVVAVAFVMQGSLAHADSLTPYFLFDGDSHIGYKIANGSVTPFETFSRGYPVAIRDSIWLGDVDDKGAREFTLNGLSTGRAIAGDQSFSQLLDGTAGPSNNFGVECCGATNSVTIANTDWSSQRVLFNIPFHGSGIAYDGLTGTLYVSEELLPTVRHYSLDGQLLDIFNLKQSLVGLAYEQASDSFWGFNRSTNNLVNFNRGGVVLQDIDIPGFTPSNPWAGEMRVAVSATPEPTSLMLLGTGVLLVARLRRHRARCSA